MIAVRLRLALLLLVGLCFAGCGSNTDRTGPGPGGLGPAGTNATTPSRSPEEQLKQQRLESAQFKKAHRLR